MIDLQGAYSSAQTLPTLAWNVADFNDAINQLQSSAVGPENAQRLFSNALNESNAADRFTGIGNDGNAGGAGVGGRDGVSATQAASFQNQLGLVDGVAQSQQGQQSGLAADNGGSYQQFLRQMEANFNLSGANEGGLGLEQRSAANLEANQGQVAASGEADNSKKGETSEKVSADPASGMMTRTVIVDGEVVSESAMPDSAQPVKMTENDANMAQQRIEAALESEKQRQQ